MSEHTGRGDRGPSGHGGLPVEGQDKGLHDLFQAWMDSDRKARLALFFRENPGTVETVEGLARRLGANAELLQEDVDAHVRLGVLKERHVGGRTVIVYDQARRGAVERTIERLIHEQERRALGGDS